MGLLDALIFGYRQIVDAAGNLLPNRSRLKFDAGFTVTDDQNNDVTLVSGGGSGGSGFGLPIDNSGTGPINAAASTSSPGVDAGQVRFTGAAPELAGLDPGTSATSGKVRYVVASAVGGPLLIRNEGGGAAATWRILTGTGADATIAQGVSVLLGYDPTSDRFRVIGTLPAASSGGSSYCFSGRLTSLDSTTNAGYFGNSPDGAYTTADNVSADFDVNIVGYPMMGIGSMSELRVFVTQFSNTVGGIAASDAEASVSIGVYRAGTFIPIVDAVVSPANIGTVVSATAIAPVGYVEGDILCCFATIDGGSTDGTAVVVLTITTK